MSAPADRASPDGPPRDPSRRAWLAASALGALGAAACARGGARRPAAPPGRAAAADPTSAAIAAIVARVRPPTFPGRRYPIAAHGAREGDADARPAIQRAIDRCAADGGGTVLVPAGRWRVDGPLHLRSGVRLHLDDAATLRFAGEPAQYLPAVPTRWEGTECFNYSPLVYAYQAVDVALTGGGTVDGGAAATFAPWRERQRDAQERLRRMGADGVPLHRRLFGEGDFLRPSFVQFFGCQNVLVEGPTFVDAPFWVLHPVYSRNVTVRGVTVDSPRLNNDGVDPDSCSDVLVERCTFRTGDDAVAVKSGRDADGWRVGRPTTHVVVRDCELPAVHNGVCIGSEMSGGVRHVYVERCRLGTVRGAALYVKANLDRGGAVEHVRVRDVTVAEAGRCVELTTDYHSYRGGRAAPRFADVAVERVRCERAATALHAVGVPESPLVDLALRDVAVARADTAAVVRHVRRLVTRGVRVNGAPLALAAEPP